MADDQAEKWARYESGGTHAYLFADGVAPNRDTREVVDALRSLMPGAEPNPLAREVAADDRAVCSASEFVGAYAAFAHVWVEGGLASLQDFVSDLRQKLGLRMECALAERSFVDSGGTTVMAKLKRCDVVALVRIWVEKGQALAVLDRLAGLGDAFAGATIVFGTFDILLELEASDLAPVTEAALGPLQEIEGIARTETSFADFRRYE